MLRLARVDAAAGRDPPGRSGAGVGVLEEQEPAVVVEHQHPHRGTAHLSSCGGGVRDDEVAWLVHHRACDTLDMLKSGTRSPGIAVREK